LQKGGKKKMGGKLNGEQRKSVSNNRIVCLQHHQRVPIEKKKERKSQRDNEFLYFKRGNKNNTKLF
jgi:hypothetical protein